MINPNNSSSFYQQSRSQHRWFTTNTVRNSSSKSPSGTRGRHDRSSFPASKVSKAIVHHGAAPFHSTLRPNLTGGALPRSASGYSIGAGRGARHFSHSPSLQAHVVQNVNAAVRAFFVNGGKARFDGFDEKTGEKRFRTISTTENEFHQLSKNSLNGSVKGTSLEFHLSPTITCLSPTAPNGPLSPEIQTVNTTELLDNLSIDFARVLKDLSAILNDLRRLSALGDLPLSITHSPSGPILALRFPGCDGATVSRLCDEANVCRGIIREDEAWVHDRDVEMALLFPLAPGDGDTTTHETWRHGNDGYFEHDSPARTKQESVDWRQMMSADGPSARTSIDDVINLGFSELTAPAPPSNSQKQQHALQTGPSKSLLSLSLSLSDYDSLRADSNFPPEDPYPHPYPYSRCSPSNTEQAPILRTGTATATAIAASTEDFEGLEGIYRFLKECEDARL